MGQQGALLDEVSRLLDAGTLRTTVTERLGLLSAVNLTRAHAMIESGRTRGKITLDGVAPGVSGAGT
jgi:NADPH:quinone reductase-like Zn-dependent oxidoreductase